MNNADLAIEPTAGQQELIDFGTALLRSNSPQAQIVSHVLPEDNAVVVVQQGRGGLSAYVAADKTVLLTGSAIPPHAALEKFRAGERTAPDRLG